MSRKAPAFQLYADDFIAGTIGMTASEVGIYIRLLCLQWTKGRISQRETLAAGGTEIEREYVISEKFILSDDGFWRNERLEIVRKISEERSKAGSKGGSKRQANVKAKLNPPTPTPTPTPIYSHTHTAAAEGFEKEWQRWCDFRLATDGRGVNEIQADAILMDLCRRGPEKAKRDIEFSIQKNAKSILDSDHDFQRTQAKTTRRAPSKQELGF